MKSLLKKEAMQLAIPFAGLLVFLCVVWIAVYRVSNVLWSPQEDPVIAVVCAGAIGGFLLALLQFYAERIHATHGYLVHRGARASDVFAAKAAVGLAATYALAAAPPAVFALWHAITSPLAPTLQWERVAELAWIGTFGLCGYAAGAACAQLRRHFVSEVILGAAAGLAFFFVAFLSARSDVESSPAVRYVLVQLAVAATVLVFAYRLFQRGGDRDLPLPRDMGSIVSVAGIVLFVVPVLVASALTQEEHQKSLIQVQPTILRERATGRFFAVQSDGDGDFAEIDAHGELVPGVRRLSFQEVVGSSTEHERIRIERDPGATAASRFDRRAPRTAEFNGRWMPIDFGVYGATYFRADNGLFALSTFFDPRDGVVRAFFEPRGPWSREIAVPGFVLSSDEPFAVTMRRPDTHGRFGPGTSIVWREHRGEGIKSACLFDPSDTTLWELDPFDARAPIRALELPDGDRVVGVELVSVPEADEARASESRLAQAVVGERGKYTWDGRGLTPLASSAPAAVASTRDYRVIVTDDDPITPQIEIRGTEGDKLLFALDARPHGFKARTTATWMHMLTVLRAPLFNVLSFLSPRDTRGDLARLAGERLFFGQRRIVTLLIGLAIAAGAARASAHRLRARGAGVLATRAWTVAVMLLGLPAYWLFVMLEPRKSASPASEAAPPRMLIQSGVPAAASAAQGVA